MFEAQEIEAMPLGKRTRIALEIPLPRLNQQSLWLPYSCCLSVSVCPPPAEPLLALPRPIPYLWAIDHR